MNETEVLVWSCPWRKPRQPVLNFTELRREAAWSVRVAELRKGVERGGAVVGGEVSVRCRDRDRVGIVGVGLAAPLAREPPGAMCQRGGDVHDLFALAQQLLE